MKYKNRYLYKILKNKEYIRAIKYTTDSIERDSDDEIIYICYILLKIYECENQYGIKNHIFSFLEINEDFQDIKKLYQSIKFGVRRFEYDLNEESKNAAINYFKTKKISGIALYYIVRYACVDRKKVIKKLMNVCDENNLYDISEQIKVMISA